MSLIIKNKSLRDLNAFGVDVSAREFAQIDSLESLDAVLSQSDLKPWVLGGGSNLLLIDDLEALVLLNAIIGIQVVAEEESHIYVRIGGGEVWHELVLWAVENGLGGIENLALIPGSVGAAPIQNIGAYGVELKDVFHSLEAFEFETGKLIHFTHEE